MVSPKVTKSREADGLGGRLANMLAHGDVVDAWSAIEPILEQKTPFRLLDRIAFEAGTGHWPETIEFLDRIAADGSEGGWVIIGSCLRQQYSCRPASTVSACRRYIVAADVWYGADILGERVPGPALVDDFARALALLESWRSDDDHWVRRSVGVAVHFWAKRSQGDPGLEGRAQRLLDFLEPMFEERDLDAVKGVGWGLKTLGKYYPQQLADWLAEQVDRPHRRLMLRKAITYLPDESRQQIMEIYGL